MLTLCCPCCNQTYFAGCFDPCGLIFDFGETVGAGDDGTWRLEADFGRRKFVVESDLIVGQDIRFDLGQINENWTYIFTLTKPDGTTYTKTINTVEYDCFKVVTKINGNSIIQL